MQNIKLLLPSSLVFSSGIRDIAQEAANLAGLGKKQINMFRLVVDEIFMNAVRYGSNSESHVLIEILIQENSIICAIEDEGKGEKQIKAEDLKAIITREKDNVSLQKGHGRGLAQITSTLVQGFEVIDKEDGGIRIEFAMQKQDDTETIQTTTKETTKKILPETIIILSGEMTFRDEESTKEKVEKLFEEHADEPFRLIYDCSTLTYCNSSMIGELAAWQERLQKLGGESVISKPTQSIYEILDLVGLTKIFRIELAPTPSVIPTPSEAEQTIDQPEENAPFKEID